MSAAASSKYVVISADGHAGADLLDYKPYLEHQFHDEFDAWAAVFHEPWAEYDTGMTDVGDDNIRVGQASFMSPYNWDDAKRLAHLDSQGIAGEVIMPNTVPPFYPASVISAWAPRDAEEYRLRLAGVRAHNRWLVDFCGRAPERRAGLVQVFLNDIDDAIAEVRWAKEQGLRGVLIPCDHMCQLVNLFEPRLDPFWAACEELAMPVHRHAIAVGPPVEEGGPAAEALGTYETYSFFQRGLAQLMYGGVFERFPDLHFVFSETMTGWVESELAALNYCFEEGRKPGTAAYSTQHKVLEGLTLTPREYFSRNVHVATSLMTSADVAARERLGVDRMMWGADYPHHEGLFPYMTLGLRWLFSDVPEDEVRKMLSENAAALYGFDLDALQVVADEIGPTVAEIATPVTADELPDYTMSITINDAKRRVAVAS